MLAPQSPVETPRPVVIEATTPAWVLMDLPSSGTLYSLLETVNPEVISNRIEGGGMYPSSPAHIGAHGSSWTQTLFRVGDINITDPDGSGTPLVFPGVLEWERVEVNTGMMGVEVNAPGMVLNLAPRRPSRTWIRQFEAVAGPPELQAGGVVPSPPTIAHLQRYGHASVLLSGPLSERLGIVFTGNYSRATRLDRDNPTELDSGLASAFTHVVYTPSPRDEVRSVFWFQRALTPVDHPLIFQEPDAQERTTAMSLQSTWERRGGVGEASWRAFAAVSARDRAQSAGRQTVVSMERLDEPPPWEQLDPGPGRNRTWQLGARMRRQPVTAFNLQHDITLGVDLSGGVASQDTWFNGRIGELVNGIPARIWEFTSPGVEVGMAADDDRRVRRRQLRAASAAERHCRLAVRAHRRLGGRRRDASVVDRSPPASWGALGHHRRRPAALVPGLRPLWLQHAAARSRLRRSVGAHRQCLPMERAGRHHGAGGLSEGAAG